MYKYIVLVALIFIVLNEDYTGAGENGSRFEGPMDRVTAKMLNIPFLPDSTGESSSTVPDGADELSGPPDNHKLEAAQVFKAFGVDTAEAESINPSLYDVSSELSAVKEPVDSLAPANIAEHEFEEYDFERRELTPELLDQYPDGKYIPRTVTNNAWEVGEHLVFDLTYSFYKAGTATMSVVEKKWVNGGECYHIRTTAKSNKFISAFYKVRDSVNSFIDIKGIFSRRIEKKLREGGYKSDRYVDFYHDRLIALNTKEKYAFSEIPLYVQDILSSLYYIRTMDLEVGKTVEIEAYADGKVYVLKVICHKRETVKVPAGEFTCLKVEPVLKSEGIFRQKGKLTIWLTDDRYKVPVKMASKVVIGSIVSKLASFQTGVTD